MLINQEFFMKKLDTKHTMAMMLNRPHGAPSQTLDMKNGMMTISTPGMRTGMMETATTTRTTSTTRRNGLTLGMSLDSMKKVLQNKLMEIPRNPMPMTRPFTRAKENPEQAQWAWGVLHVAPNGTTPTAVL